jgi:Mg2+/citrate symporter
MKTKILDRIAIILSIVLLLLLSFILGSGERKRINEKHINKSEITNFSIKYTTTNN